MRNRTILLFLFVLCIGGLVLPGQQAIPGPGIAQQPSGQSASNRTISFSGTLDGQPDGALPIAFFIYSDRQSTAPLWSETQTIQITGGKYTAVLGSESPSGIPPELFTGDTAHWLGVEVNGREQRFLLVSVPYAMKAVDAERFGGLLPSQFVTAADLQAALRNAATGQAKQPPAHPGAGPAPLAAATGTPPQPATDFTDNNASEVLLVTQQGTGFAIHAISGGDAAIFAENSGLTGTAIRGSATATSGATTGVLGQAASPSGTAGAFESTNGAKIMSFRANGGEVGSIDQSGQIFAQNFAGPGFGLTNIPNSATTASSGNFPDAIVARDSFGSFSAGQIFAQNFAGPGFGLTNIPNSATTANSGNFPDAIVVRDSLGSFSAGQIFAQNFTGPGFGLTNIPNSATTATEQNLSGAIVARDIFGNFAAGQIFAQSFTGSGFGLTNIPNSATTAQSSNTPDTIVARGPSGEFAAGTVTASGVMTNLFLANIGTFDSSNAVSTLPVKSVLSINTPATCTQSRELLVKMDATPGQQLFICNSTGDGWLLVGDGTSAGVSSVTAGDSSISVGGAAFAPTISVADGGITAAKFAPNAVAGSIADGSLTPAKIAGTAATLGSNTFSGNQTVQGSVTSVSLSTGPVTSTSATVSGNSSGNLVSVSQSGTGAGLAVTSSGASFSPAINATSSQNSDAIDAHSVFGSAIFAVSTNGVGITSNGGGTGVQATGATAVLANSSAINGVAVSMSTGPSGRFLSGISGTTETFNVDVSGNLFSAGALSVRYSNNTVFGTFVNQLARFDAAGAVERTFPTDTSGIAGVVIGGAGFSGSAQVAYSGVANCLFDNAAAVGDYVVNSSTTPGFCSDAGLAYPASGQVVGRVLKAGAPNAALPIFLFGPEVHGFAGGSVISINTGAGLTGGPITSTGTISVATGGVTNTMLQNSSVTVNAGTGLSGGGTASLGGAITLNNAGALSFNGRAGNVAPAAGDYSFSQISGAASTAQLPTNAVYNDQANTFTGNQAITGTLNVSSTVTAAAFSGDGSAVTNVNAAKIGGLTSADLATSAALASESLARQTADAALQDNINTESSTRAAADITLQANIDSVNASAARLAASNTFTAGTQDFSGAGATLPVHTVTIAQTPATCVGGKELLIKTDAPGGQQLFICNATANGWNLVGDGASGGVTSFNGRSGSVAPSAGDYSFDQVSGSIAAAQMPALSGDVVSSAGSTATTLAASGVAPGTYTKVTVDAKGRATAGAQAAFADLSGSATSAQLPATVVYNNQANTFTGNQTVAGAVIAITFSGDGGGLTGVNAASLNGLGPGVFAQLASANAFTAKQTLAASTAAAASLNMPDGAAPTAPSPGDIWNTGGVIQYRDNASLTRSLVSTTQTGGAQLLKLTASITPASVSPGSCAEQSFAVSGLATTDMVLAVAQPSTSSPGTNIAIGGSRVSADNTIAIQFCNVTRNSSSTPVAGTYTLAIMR